MDSKKFINITIYGFLLAGTTLLLFPNNDFPDFYNPLFMSIMAFLAVLIISLPKIIVSSQNKEKIIAIENFQKTLAYSLILNGLGSVGFYKFYTLGFQYDKFVHFFIPFILFFGFSNFLKKLKDYSVKKSIIIAAIAIFSGGLLWEIIEFIFDYLFKTQTLGLYGKDIINDTIFDIIFNTLGILCAIIIKSIRQK